MRAEGQIKNGGLPNLPSATFPHPAAPMTLRRTFPTTPTIPSFPITPDSKVIKS
jgi:hypothetical protein